MFMCVCLCVCVYAHTSAVFRESRGVRFPGVGVTGRLWAAQHECQESSLDSLQKQYPLIITEESFQPMMIILLPMKLWIKRFLVSLLLCVSNCGGCSPFGRQMCRNWRGGTEWYSFMLSAVSVIHCGLEHRPLLITRNYPLQFEFC